MKLRHLRENVSHDPKINDQIEAAIAAFPKSVQTQLLDALDALKMAGEQGLSPQEWAAKVRELHPDVNLAELLKATVKAFPFAVDRIGDRQYGYREDALGGIDAGTKAAMKSQVRLASEVMRAMEAMGEFSLDDIAQRIASMTGMPEEQAARYAEHVINQFQGGKIQMVGPDRYAVHGAERKSSEQHVQDLKDLIKRAGLGNADDVEEQTISPTPPTQATQPTTPTQTSASTQTSPQDKAKQDQLITRLHKAVDSLDMVKASPDTIEKALPTVHDDAAHRAMPVQDLAKVVDKFEDIARREQADKAQQGSQAAPQLTAQQKAAAAQQASTFEGMDDIKRLSGI